MSFEGTTNIKLYLYKLVTFSKQLASAKRSSNTKQEIYEQVQVALDDFQDRMLL